MSEKTKAGLAVLAAAIALGVAGDALLHVGPWGINAPLFVTALVVAWLAVARGQRVALRGGGRWLLAPALLLAAGIAWRDSLTLDVLAGAAALLALALAAFRSRSGSIRLASLTDYALGGMLAGWFAWTGIGFLLLSDVRWKEIPRGGWSRRAVPVARGLLLALPLLLLFGALFAAADATFERLVTRLFAWDAEAVFEHLLLASACAWAAGGLLREALVRNEVEELSLVRPAGIGLGITELGIVLGALDALFLVFVLVQGRYFFGGAAMVRDTAGLTCAAYARRGFFELVTVAALALPLLLAADWALKAEKRSHYHLFRLLAGLLVALLFAVLASALQRMLLYQRAFGLTELRLYVTAAIGWLAALFAWFGATVLRGQRDRFAFGALIAGFTMVGGLYLLNPDALIAQTNTARMAEGRPLDAGYVTSLSADAVPAAIAALPRMNAAARKSAATALLKRWSPPRRVDWRSWNLSRAQAWSAVAANRDALGRAASGGEL
jgi:hypothetical protein